MSDNVGQGELDSSSTQVLDSEVDQSQIAAGATEATWLQREKELLRQKEEEVRAREEKLRQTEAALALREEQLRKEKELLITREMLKHQQPPGQHTTPNPQSSPAQPQANPFLPRAHETHNEHPTKNTPPKEPLTPHQTPPMQNTPPRLTVQQQKQPPSQENTKQKVQQVRQEEVSSPPDSPKHSKKSRTPNRRQSMKQRSISSLQHARLISGTMQKRGQAKGKFDLTNWKTRFFGLTSEELLYFTDASEQSLKGGVELAQVVYVEKVRDGEFDKRPFVFQVGYIEDGVLYTLYVQAKDEEEQELWMGTTRKVMRHKVKKLADVYHPGHFSKRWTCCEGERVNRGCTPCSNYDIRRATIGAIKGHQSSHPVPGRSATVSAGGTRNEMETSAVGAEILTPNSKTGSLNSASSVELGNELAEAVRRASLTVSESTITPQPGEEIHVTLKKQPKESFGLRFCGSRDDEGIAARGPGIFIKKVLPSTPAAAVGRDKLRPGYRVLSACGVNTKLARMDVLESAIKNATDTLELVVTPSDEEFRQFMQASCHYPRCTGVISKETGLCIRCNQRRRDEDIRAMGSRSPSGSTINYGSRVVSRSHSGSSAAQWASSDSDFANNDPPSGGASAPSTVLEENGDIDHNFSEDEWTIDDYEKNYTVKKCHIVANDKKNFGVEFTGPSNAAALASCGRGIFILRVKPGSAVEQAGLRPGDRLLSMDGEDVSKISLTDLNKVIERVSNKTEMVAHEAKARLTRFLSNLCPKCSWPMEPSDTFCTKCGTKKVNNKGDKWELNRDVITVTGYLGKGNFGEVERGEFRLANGSVANVAIKTCTKENSSSMFIAEAIKMKAWSHKNLVKLHGVCSINEPMWIVLELVTGGGLEEYLRSKKADNFTPSIYASLLCDISSGMFYLNSNNWIHLDLALRNLLVDTAQFSLGLGSAPVVKVCDFGLAMQVADENTPSRLPPKVMLPVRWTAPEVWTTRMATITADVWSFGIIMHEILTRGRIYPYWDHKGTSQELMDKINNNYRIPREKCIPIQYYQLMRVCWAPSPNLRPKFDVLESVFDVWRSLPGLSVHNGYLTDGSTRVSCSLIEGMENVKLKKAS
eukprot:m.119684 g.119684  ORF g.119684 m.119684 type:complete len:1099 (-) comp14327_c0_seq2:94-3390(-)